MNRILLLGKNGQLGWELQRTLSTLGHVVALDRHKIDLTKPEDVRRVVKDYRPEVIVNAAAYTAVDRAESEPEIAMAVNAHAPGLLAELAADMGAVLIHYSTDYVFDGEKGSPYLETDQPNPLNSYGQSKLAGEQAVASVDGVYLILRTSWVYSLRGESFLRKVLQWSRQLQHLRVVSDQVGNPTWSRLLAEASAQLLAAKSKETVEHLRMDKGIYHVAGSGYASRLEWARAILQFDPHKDEQTVQEVSSAQTSEFPSPALRPAYSALDCSLFEDTFGIRLPEWRHALQLSLEGMSTQRYKPA